MPPVRVRKHGHRNRERGFSLLLALVFVGFFGGVLAAIALFNRNAVRLAEADVAGWELVEIGKAARLYVRDRLVTDPNLRDTAATPSRININILRNNGYLPANFGRRVGTREYNALNQEIHVIMANWGPSGLTLTNDPASVPSAFVFFRQGGKSDLNRIMDLVESARKYGATITSPLFNTSNTNLSASCRSSGPAAGIWDTGCLTQAEFASLVTPLGLPAAFSAGALIVPAWKMTQQDLRAVMRYPQPENQGYATMLTDLVMANKTTDTDGTDDNKCATKPANQITVTTLDTTGKPTNTYTGLCKVSSDTTTKDNRFNILNVANMTTERVIAEPQTTDFGGTDTASLGSGNEESLNVSGNIVLGNDLRVFNTRPLNGVAYRFSVPRASIAVERNAYLYSQNTSRKGAATIGNMTSNALLTDSFTTNTLSSTAAGVTTGAATISATKGINISGTTSVTGTANSELITDTLTGASATLNASDDKGQVQITNRLSLSGNTLKVTGATKVSGYSAIIGNIDNADDVKITGTGGTTKDLNFKSSTGSLTTESTFDYAGTAKMATISANNGSNSSQCLEGVNVSDACPNRQYFVPFLGGP